MTERRPYRPPIRAVLLLMLLIAVATPMVGLFFFRVFENQLIRKTEGELIAQSAAIASVYRLKVAEIKISPKTFGLEAPEDVADGYKAVFSPFGASLDLASDPGQTQDLFKARRNESVVRRLLTTARQTLEEARGEPMIDLESLDAETRQKLEALGYLDP